MIQPRDETHRALKRMLSNGPLAAVPKRPPTSTCSSPWPPRSSSRAGTTAKGR
jgi:hypothetical protein